MRRLLPIAAVLAVLATGSLVPPAAAGVEAPTVASAAAKKSKKKPKKCKKGHVRKKVKVGKGKKRRTVVRCVKSKRKPGTTQPTERPVPAPAPEPSPQPAPQPAPQTAPQEDAQARYADLISRMQLLRTYQVPKPGGGGYNTHSEQYGWCNPGSGRRMIHYYEGIAYIYKSNGPYTILSGSASADGSTGDGMIRYVQEQANFQEEVGKVQEIRISWTGDVATVVHPEIGTNNFAKTVRSNENC